MPGLGFLNGDEPAERPQPELQRLRIGHPLTAEDQGLASRALS